MGACARWRIFVVPWTLLGRCLAWRTSGNSFTRRCRILHKIGRSEAWIRPPEPQDLAGELVGRLRGDPLVNTSYERLLPLDLDLHKNAGCCGVSAEEVRGVGPKEHHSSAEDPTPPRAALCGLLRLFTSRLWRRTLGGLRRWCGRPWRLP